MSYNLLKPRQKQLVDEIMDGKHCGRIKDQVVQNRLGPIFWKYGIDEKKWCARVRLVYLRAKELGLIQ